LIKVCGVRQILYAVVSVELVGLRIYVGSLATLGPLIRSVHQLWNGFSLVSAHLESGGVAHVGSYADILRTPPCQKLVGWAVKLGYQVLLLLLVFLVWTLIATSVLVDRRGPQAFGLRVECSSFLGFENGIRAIGHEL